jgi:2-amino-4-hydroxy-6-hydroxymethyldihydropteridine diphosphokinase
MILIAIGANLPSERFGPPLAACAAALERMSDAGLKIMARSRWFESDPVPPSDQPKYVNGVAAVETGLEPRSLLDKLLEIEAGMGRVRGERNAARVIDLDLLAYDDRRIDSGGLTLPHPRLRERGFVLLPLADIAPDWHHPVSGTRLAELIAALPADHGTEPIEAGAREDG